MIRRAALLAPLLALALAACSGDEEQRLEGAREPLRLTEAENVIVDPTEIRPVPPQTPFQDWPQINGDAAHSGGHVAGPSTLSLAWRVDVDAANGDLGPTGAPVIAGGTVFVRDAAAGVVALDASSGAVRWRADVGLEGEGDDAGYGGGLAWDAGRLFVTTGFGEILALDPASGEILWRTRRNAPFRGPPTASEGLVTAVSRANMAVALAADSGAVVWTVAGLSTRTGALSGAAPAAVQGAVALPFGSGDLILARAGQGTEIWASNLSRTTGGAGLAAFPDVTADPVVIGPLIVAANAAGQTVAIEGRSGRQAWRRGFGSLSPLWPAGDTLFATTTEPRLMRLDSRTGATIWATPLPAFEDPEDAEEPITWAGPVLMGGRVWITGTDGALEGWDPVSGQRVTALEMPSGSATGPVAAGGTLYVLTDDGALLAYR